VEETGVQSNPNSPSFLESRFPLDWQMTRPERFALIQLLEHAKPRVALEVGTYRGGSLQVVSSIAEKVYSLDLDPGVPARLSARFPNVEFHTGNSAVLVPKTLETIERNREELGFVLIDGDHTTQGVLRDINSVLEYRPVCPVFLVCHDSFHPPCREGMLRANWQKCPYVHYVEIDFVPGVFHFEAFDTAEPRSMYGGLAVALLRPEERAGDLMIHQSQRGLYDAVFAASRYGRRPRGIRSRIGKFLGTT
jgi:hypothetical protein